MSGEMKDTAQEQISPRKDIHLGMCTSKEFFRKAGRLGQIDRVGLAFLLKSLILTQAQMEEQGRELSDRHSPSLKWSQS